MLSTVSKRNDVDAALSRAAAKCGLVIIGTNLVPGNVPASGVTWSSAPEFVSDRIPAQLGGYPVSVTVNNRPAYLYFFCSAAATG
jgi:hypothetical protein